MRNATIVGVNEGEPSFLRNAKCLFDVMSSRRRFQLFITIGLAILGAFLELVTIGAVLPLLSLTLDNNYFESSRFMQGVLRFINAEPGALLKYFAILLAIAAALSAVTRSMLVWLSQKVVWGIQYDITMLVFGKLLRQPYENYVRENSSKVLAGVEKIHVVSVGIVSPVIAAFTSAWIAASIIVFLFVVDPLTASLAAASMGLVYLSISMVTRKILLKSSRRAALVWTQRLRIIQESWGGMRDIILDESQPIFERKLAKCEHENQRLQVLCNFVTDAPRFWIESFAIVLVSFLVLYFASQPAGLLAAIPILGGLALGAQRLLPLIQAVYRGWASYSLHAHALQDVTDLLQMPVSGTDVRRTRDCCSSFQAPVAIELRDVRFDYAPGETILENINLIIKPGERVGLIGKTGSGKSTLADIIMGLLSPTSGRILLNGEPLDPANAACLRSRVAHVPQVIYLSDDTIAANIAFGYGDVDMARVWAAAERANIRSYVEQLPSGFSTVVGERGIRLSGGQRQRIGIARALYKNASILILDEATSALDEHTEAVVMDSFTKLDRDLTLILIAHRLTTVAGCDRIYRLEAGRVVQAGTYEEVIARPHQAA